MSRLSRRDFLHLAAAAGASGGLGPWGMREVSAAQAQAALASADNWIATCCNMCGGTTGVLAHVVNGRVVKLEPNSDNPVGISNISTDYVALKPTGARMCGKGNASLMSLYDPDRVKTPLKRVPGSARGSGQFIPIPYEQALAEIATRLAEIRATAGPDKLLWFSEDATAVAIQEAFCNAFGTPNFMNHSNICDVARKVGFEKTLGFHRPLPDLRNTKYMLLFGWNPLGAIKWVHLPRILLDGLAKGAKLVVVDPRCSETAEKAIDDARGEWLPIRPGTDGAMALAMGHVIVNEGLYDQAFVNDWSTGFNQYAAFVANKTPEWAAGITGIAADTIRRIAREVAAAKPAVIDSWSGTSHHTNGVEATRAIAMLAGLLGQIDAPGTLILPDRRGPKFEVGTPSTLARIDGRGTKYPFGHSSGVYVEARDAMLASPPGQRPRAAVFMMQNFVFSVPNSRKTLDALNALELIVSVDTHLSETALMADYVIPGSNYLERYELAPQWVTFPVVALRQPVVAPVHGQRLEYEFVMDLARALGHNRYPFNGSYERFLDDGLMAGIGISLEQLKALPGATWIGGPTRYRKHQELDADGAQVGFKTESGKFEFYSEPMKRKGLSPLPEYVPVQDRTSSTYPLALINWKEALHTHSRTMNNRWLMELRGENMLWINTNRASSLGIRDGDTVSVQNEYGSAQAKARVTGRIHPDVVGMCHGFGHWGLGPVARGKGINDSQFVPGRAEAISGMAVHKDAAVRVSFVARAPSGSTAPRRRERD